MRAEDFALRGLRRFVLPAVMFGVLLVTMVLAAFVSDSAAAPSPAQASVTVRPGNDRKFHPASVRVPVGTTVRWVFKSASAAAHQIWSYDGKNPTGPVSINGGTTLDGEVLGGTARTEYSHTFAKPGTYPYFCHDHYADGMVGEVVVLAAGQTTAPPVYLDNPPDGASTAAAPVAASPTDSPGRSNTGVIALGGVGVVVAAGVVFAATRRARGTKALG
ncbi:MAG: plastocyanin/azurin family copper-binding protein [Mycobacteriales bacterium]